MFAVCSTKTTLQHYSSPDARSLFPSEYERDLEEVIKDETSGDFTTALLAMLKANKDESDEVDLDQARSDAEVWTFQCMMCILQQRCSQIPKATKLATVASLQNGLLDTVPF